MLSELERTEQLGLPYLVVHPGAHRGQGTAAGIEVAAATLDEVFRRARARHPMVLLETTSGAGSVLELPEKHFDAVTALSGSGPAFVAYVMQAMIEGAAALKLPKDAARLLAEQTLIGTGIYLQNTGRDTAAFIQAVASPKGTTAAGLAVLEKSSVKTALAKTLAAAAARSAELSRA